MIKRLAFLALLGMLGLVVLALAVGGADPQPSGVEADRAYWALQLDQQDAAATASSRQLGQQLLNIAPALGVLALALAPVVVLGTWALDRRAARRRLYPDANGFYPQLDPTVVARELAPELAQHLALTLAGGNMAALVERHKQAPVYLPAAKHTPPALPGPVEPVATLPDQAPLAEALATIPRGHLAYGVLPSGQLLTMPLGSSYHGLYHGDTRSGKTNAIDGMIVQLHHMASRMPIALAAGDFKQELDATWSTSPLFSRGIATEPGQITEMLAELVHGPDGVKARYEGFKRLGSETGRIVRNVGDYGKVTGERPLLVVAFVDEINAVLKAAGRNSELASTLTQLLQMGAGAGIFLMGGAQYLTAGEFGREGSKQFVTRAAFGAYDGTAARMLFSVGVADGDRGLLTGQPGRGLIRTANQAQPVPFQAFRCDEDDILGAIDLVRSGASSATERAVAGWRYESATDGATRAPERPETTLEGGATASDQAGALERELGASPAATVAPEERAAILAAYEELKSASGQAVSLRAVCRTVYNTTGGAGFNKVKTVLGGAA